MTTKLLLVSAVIATVGAIQVAAAVPETVAKIVNVEVDRAHPKIVQMEYVNTGQRPITAIVIQHTLHPGQVVFADFPGSPLKKGESRAINGWDDYNGPLEVAVVVFDDGTVVGKAVDAFSAEDVATEIFNLRHAQALEWAKWERLIDQYSDSDSHKAVEALIQAAKAIQIRENRSTVDGGQIVVQQLVQNLARDAEKQLNDRAHDEAWIHQYLARTVIGHSATSRAQDNVRREAVK